MEKFNIDQEKISIVSKMIKHETYSYTKYANVTALVIRVVESESDFQKVGSPSLESEWIFWIWIYGMESES